MAYFDRIKLKGWRQFDNLDIDLSKRLTILTGQNGCGKTTILNTLNIHFGWSINFVSTPYMSKRRRKRVMSDMKELEEEHTAELGNGAIQIGSIIYSNQNVCPLITNREVAAQYKLQYGNLQAVNGMHIPSHRPNATYNAVSHIPTNANSAAQQHQSYQQLLIQLYGGGRSGSNPGHIQKQSLISLALFGEGNSSVASNPEFLRLFEGFQEILRKVLPETIGFQRIEIRMPEVVMVTDTGDFSIDAMSGGINAIFSIAWQIFMYSHDKESFVITIDEPENHLHPTMQRSFLPNLIGAFPNCRVIAATHSPFVVSSFPDANVYALVSGPSGVNAHKLDTSDLSGTPNEVLREILDVGSNLPIWVEQEIFDVIESNKGEPAETRADKIMDALERLGLADAIVEYRRKNL